MIARILRWFGLAPVPVPARAYLEAVDRDRLAAQRESYRQRRGARPIAPPECVCFGAGCGFCSD